MGTVHQLHPRFDEELEAAYARVKAEVAEAGARGKRFGGPCKECRFYRKYDGAMYFGRSEYCQHPLVQTHSFSEQEGRIVSRSFPLLAAYFTAPGPQRQIPDLCGETRRLWEPKPTFWQRLFAWFMAPWS